MLTISRASLRTAAAAVLTTAVGALAFANVAVVSSSIDTSPLLVTGSAEAANSSAQEAGLYSPDPPQSLSETVTRPVFFADRKPIAEKAAAEQPEAAAEPTAGSLQLLGTVRLGKGKVMALIRSAEAQAGVWIPVGETVEGWKLREVSSDQAVLEANGKRVELKLSYAAHGAAPADAASPPPPQ